MPARGPCNAGRATKKNGRRATAASRKKNLFLLFSCFEKKKYPFAAAAAAFRQFIFPYTTYIPPGQQQIIDSEFPGQPLSVGPPPLPLRLETERISWSLWPIGGDLLSIGFRAVRPLYFLIHFYIFAMNIKKALLIDSV